MAKLQVLVGCSVITVLSVAEERVAEERVAEERVTEERNRLEFPEFLGICQANKLKVIVIRVLYNHTRNMHTPCALYCIEGGHSVWRQERKSAGMEKIQNEQPVLSKAETNKFFI